VQLDIWVKHGGQALDIASFERLPEGIDKPEGIHLWDRPRKGRRVSSAP
jgi:hypothetical protein